MPPPFLRSLRSRLLLLFAALAVGPLATVGVVDYARSQRMIRALIVDQTGTLAHSAAASVADRYALVRSDVLLLSENTEVQQLLRDLARGDATASATASATANATANATASATAEVQRAANDYLASVWQLAGASYFTAILTDTRGAPRWQAGGDSTLRDHHDRLLTIREPVRELESKRVVGALAITPRPTTVWPRDLFATSFGRRGYGVVIDRRSNRIIFHSRPTMVGRMAHEIFGEAWSQDSARVARGSGTLEYVEHDTLRIASYVSLDSPTWTVLSSTAFDEFATPFAQAKRFDAALFALLISVVAGLFVIFIGRATRSLEELTKAATAIGRGDLSPTLPNVGPDEVGTLSGAFAGMTERVRTMMREIEVSRQLAVLGEFAAQLSHEVRNPLTSLKLDLQGLQRQVRSGALPPSAEAPVSSSLREVDRLDKVVRGVLELAHQPSAARRPFCLYRVFDDSITALHAQLEEQNIVVERELYRASIQLVGDPELLSGMFMNLLINAAEAQPDGGRIGVASVVRRADDGGEWIDWTIADDGPGVAVDKRHDIFRPFHTSRHDGTGLGLALALRTAREHGGHITCESASNGFRGAAFIVSLPVPAS